VQCESGLEIKSRALGFYAVAPFTLRNIGHAWEDDMSTVEQ